MIHLPERHRILVVDDEPDVFTLTRMTLRQVTYHGHGVELVQATSGAACIAELKAHPETSVILLDVVMESEHAGLDACRVILVLLVEAVQPSAVDVAQVGVLVHGSPP